MNAVELPGGLGTSPDDNNHTFAWSGSRWVADFTVAARIAVGHEAHLG
jgi:hypothetical protein